MNETKNVLETLVRYAEGLVEIRSLRHSEDKFAWNLFITVKSGGLKHTINTFDESKGLLDMITGGKRIFGYDEYEGLRLAVTQIYRFGRLRIVVITAFKPGAKVIWPPQPRKER